MSTNTQVQILHALDKLQDISAKFGEGTGTDRDLFQFGYNAGRFSELTGLGRYVWDSLKDKVESGNWEVVSFIVWDWLQDIDAGNRIGPPPAEE